MSSNWPEDMRRSLETVYRVSMYLDFPFTLREVADYFLPGANVTEIELQGILSSGEFADIPFRIRDGYLFTQSNQNSESRTHRENISAQKLGSAVKFAKSLAKLAPWIMTIAVTGSVAYGSARENDDIDLFIITKRGRLWITLLLALAYVRVIKLLRLETPMLVPFCMSYVHDEYGFRKESRKAINPLFARELLKAVPLTGKEQYRQILEENDWVRFIHASPYAAKLTSLPSIKKSRVVFQREYSLFDWAEELTYYFLGSYLRIRAYLTNLGLRSRGQKMRLFQPVLTRNSCVYTSNLYRWLRDLWGIPQMG